MTRRRCAGRQRVDALPRLGRARTMATIATRHDEHDDRARRRSGPPTRTGSGPGPASGRHSIGVRSSPAKRPKKTSDARLHDERRRGASPGSPTTTPASAAGDRADDDRDPGPGRAHAVGQEVVQVRRGVEEDRPQVDDRAERGPGRSGTRPMIAPASAPADDGPDARVARHGRAPRRSRRAANAISRAAWPSSMTPTISGRSAKTGTMPTRHR